MLFKCPSLIPTASTTLKQDSYLFNPQEKPQPALDQPVLEHRRHGKRVLTKSVLDCYSPQKRRNLGLNDLNSNQNKYIQWRNRDSLCWLDVSLACLFLTPALAKLFASVPSFLSEVCQRVQQAQLRYRGALELEHGLELAKSSQFDQFQISSSIGCIYVRIGGGSSTSSLSLDHPDLMKSNPSDVHEMTVEDLHQISSTLLGKARTQLEEMRAEVWQTLQTVMQLKRGKCQLKASDFNENPFLSL